MDHVHCSELHPLSSQNGEWSVFYEQSKKSVKVCAVVRAFFLSPKCASMPMMKISISYSFIFHLPDKFFQKEFYFSVLERPGWLKNQGLLMIKHGKALGSSCVNSLKHDFFHKLIPLLLCFGFLKILLFPSKL